MRLRIRLPQALVGVGLACFAAVGAALVSQHVFGMLPCPWCVLQRLQFLVLGALALAGAAAPRALRLPVLGLAVLTAASGLAAALWQQFHAAKQLSCNLTLADQIVSGLGLDSALPDVFMAMASCADAQVNLAGVPYALWSAAGFVLALFVLVRGLRMTARGLRG